jgi:hypothetical protein
VRLSSLQSNAEKCAVSAAQEGREKQEHLCAWACVALTRLARTVRQLQRRVLCVSRIGSELPERERRYSRGRACLRKAAGERVRA